MLTKEPISPSDEKNKDKQGKAARHMLGFKRQVASGKWQVASGKRQAASGQAGRGMAAAGATPGVADPTTCNGVKTDRERRLTDAGAKPVSPVLKRAAAYFANDVT
ncbi:hypothetical protein [Ralstonia solanacearum]|uniref:hypothetical protein n=1 Tax=Ralstonia solanacearum TaxID=305 RepID=UPI0011AF7617|nr:hypothetical protein [Ralstonia solanacearum]